MELKISVSQHPLPIAILKVVVALFILPLSLAFYLIGLLLTITIVGAVLGIPIVLATYAIDVLALSALMSPRSKATKVLCPNCGKGKYIIPFSMDRFRCKKCKKLIEITFKRDKG